MQEKEPVFKKLPVHIVTTALRVFDGEVFHSERTE